MSCLQHDELRKIHVSSWKNKDERKTTLKAQELATRLGNPKNNAEGTGVGNPGHTLSYSQVAVVGHSIRQHTSEYVSIRQHVL